jgi:hypothetical protein
MLEETTVFLLESLLWKVLLEDGAVVTHFEGTTAPYTTDLDTNPVLAAHAKMIDDGFCRM